ncbi:MAG: DUF559 domain-containing protein [Armatimonadota bacterium]
MRAKLPKAPSTLEGEFLHALRLFGQDLPQAVPEFVFAPPRKFRADFCYTDARLLVELEGGVWSGGKHGRGSGIQKDCEKANHAAMHGYRVMRFTIKDFETDPEGAIKAVRTALATKTPAQEAG